MGKAAGEAMDLLAKAQTETLTAMLELTDSVGEVVQTEKKDLADVYAIEQEAVEVWTHHLKAKSLDYDALFTAIDTGSVDEVDLEEFTAFFKVSGRPASGTEAPELTDESLKKVLTCLDDEEKGCLAEVLKYAKGEFNFVLPTPTM
jgi:hypothetical protein